jgi:hypothetical protein
MNRYLLLLLPFIICCFAPPALGQEFSPDIERAIKAGNLTRQEAQLLYGGHGQKSQSSSGVTASGKSEQRIVPIGKTVSFKGISLLIPFEGQLPPCPPILAGVPSWQPPPEGPTCYRQLVKSNVYTIHNIPGIRSPGGGIAVLLNGKIESLLIDFPSDQATSAYKSLTDSIGMPNLDLESFKTATNDKIYPLGAEVAWVAGSGNVFVGYRKTNSEGKYGAIYFTTKTYQEYRKNRPKL